MNPLDAMLVTGTVGELLLQLRLLECGVQSVATHKDSGNDLLATRDEAFRALQVKTTRCRDGRITFNFNRTMRKKFHILAFVFLEGEGFQLQLDRSSIYLLTRPEVQKGCYTLDELRDKELTADRIQHLFTADLRAT